MCFKKLGKIRYKVFGLVFLLVLVFVGGVVSKVAYAAPGDGATSGAVADAESSTATTVKQDGCKLEFGGLAFIGCQIAQVSAKGLDSMYSVVSNFAEDALVINPLKVGEGNPVYSIWSKLGEIVNAILVIGLLVVIFCQIYGIQLINYELKKILPKIIMAAVFTNLSFMVVSGVSDLFNVIGQGISGLFKTIEESVGVGASSVNTTEVFEAIAGGAGALTLVGAGTAVGASIVLESGLIWTLVPLLLGGVVSVAIGLFTISLRQAVVTILAMISGLAIATNLFPGLEGLFKQWKRIAINMFGFYPMFSILFGASKLAGMAIISSATSGFWVIIGLAVQFLPLFYAWSLMSMTGTILGNVSAKLRSFASPALGAAGGWAASRGQLRKAKTLAKENPKQWQLRTRLMQFLDTRRRDRGNQVKEIDEMLGKKSARYTADKNYRKDGTLSLRGQESYSRIARGVEYDKVVIANANVMNNGVGGLGRNEKENAKLDALDSRMVKAADELYVQSVKAEVIDYNNKRGRYNRMNDAINAHFDEENGYELNKNGERVRKAGYKHHFDGDALAPALERYKMISDAMDKNEVYSQYVFSSAAHDRLLSTRIIQGKSYTGYTLVPPTADNVNRLTEITKKDNAADYIDFVTPAMNVLIDRGDTKLAREQLLNVLNSKEGVKLGSYASQQLANWCLDVGDKDPALKRFGKYVNLETAAFYSGGRELPTVTFSEYVNGFHKEPDGSIKYAKHGGMIELLAGTSFSKIEREALENIDDSLREVCKKDDGSFDVDKWDKMRKKVESTIGPALLSASLTAPSGSEQLRSIVTFLTGYKYKMRLGRDDKPMFDAKTGLAEYDMVPIWNNDGERKHFEDSTLGRIAMMTLGQFLGERSDFKKPIFQHFAEAFMGESEDNLTQEEQAVQNILKSKRDALDSSSPNAESEEKRINAEAAAAQLRRLLRKNGDFDMLKTTLESGVATNAKSWLLDMLNWRSWGFVRKEENSGDDSDSGSGSVSKADLRWLCASARNGQEVLDAVNYIYGGDANTLASLALHNIDVTGKAPQDVLTEVEELLSGPTNG